MNKPCAFCTGSGYPCLELRENRSGVSGDNPGERNTSCRLLHGNQGPHTVRGTSQRSIHGWPRTRPGTKVQNFWGSREASAMKQMREVRW